MVARRRRTQVSKIAPRKFEGLTDLLSKLEMEAERVVRRLIEKTEQSSRELKNSVSTLVDQVRSEGLATFASEKTEDFLKLAEEVIGRAKEIQFTSFNRDDLIREAKKNIEDLVSRINSSDILARARVRALNTKDQVLSILSIPTQTEVVKLSRKITNLESRVNKLTRKAA